MPDSQYDPKTKFVVGDRIEFEGRTGTIQTISTRALGKSVGGVQFAKTEYVVLFDDDDETTLLDDSEIVMAEACE